MSMFNVLPGFQKTPAGLERQILRRLPRITWVGTVLFGAMALLIRALPWSGNEAEVWTRINTIDIYLIGLGILHWTVVLTVAIGAFIVMVMKGPAYVADAYPLVESEHPAPANTARPPTQRS
jgi:preprotein translocase subunit SecY